MAVSNLTYPNILYPNVSAFAGNTIGTDTVEQKERFSIPGITGNLVAFTIKGDSMFPTIKPSDMVICSPLQSLNEIRDNEIYTIITNEFVWVKRVQVLKGNSGSIFQLKLISDNHLEYDPFLVTITEIKKVLKVKLKLTGFD